jgi:hypothetical protein
VLINRGLNGQRRSGAELSRGNANAPNGCMAIDGFGSEPYRVILVQEQSRVIIGRGEGKGMESMDGDPLAICTYELLGTRTLTSTKIA